MKTAISLKDDLLKEADATALAMGVSRSRLVALALSDFLQKQRSAQMLRRLNGVYGDGVKAPEKGLLRGIKAKVSRTVKERW